MSAVEVAPAAELRVIETVPEGIVLDTDGTEAGWGPALDTRVRLGLDLAWQSTRLLAETDVFSGQLFGATWSLPGLDERGRDQNDALSLEGVSPRKLAIGGRTPWFDVEIGLDTSTWGLGMLANDGAADPLFGRTDFGDRVLRLRLATRPLGEARPLYLVVAGDRVVADELARMSEGDVAWQGVLALLYRPGDDQIGLYGVLRDQRDDRDAHTAVRVLDGFVDTAWKLGDLDLGLAAEAGWISGRTDVSRTYAAPDGVVVGSGGLAVRTRLGPADGDRWALHLRGALASGDRSADDGRVGDFRFDRDYDVGFVLFDEVLSAIDLAAWRQVTDPTLAGVPPDGADTLAAEGAFHQAVALQPAVEVAPLPWLGLRTGLVLAWSTAPIAQPFTTFRNGGVPTNHLGVASDGRYLGTELDWAIGTREAAMDWKIRPSAEIQVGHVWPSASLSGVQRVDHLLLVARARY